VIPGVEYRWRGEIADEELVELTESHGGNSARGWWDQIRGYSLGWVTARSADGAAVGFVNVAWDGCAHAFLLDTKVRPDHQRGGVGTELVRQAALHSKRAGCEWIHVDFEDSDGLGPFYLSACGFQPTRAGVIHLPDMPDML